MKRVWIILISIGVVGTALFVKQNVKPVPYAADPTAGMNSVIEEKLYQTIAGELNDLGIPSVQMSIIANGREYDLAVGTADCRRREAITDAQILRAGSITKLYTATMIMKLMEEGYLSLEDAIDTWYPEIPGADMITIRNLLNHTSGVYSYTENTGFQIRAALSPRRIWRPGELYQYILKGEPYFTPGDAHHYSNSNYLLLGMIAEKATGDSYEVLLHRIVLDDLGLAHTYFLPVEERPGDLIAGYDRDLIPLGVHRIGPENNVWASAGYSAGGIAANASDIAKFLKALFSYEIIGKDSLREMTAFGDFTDEDIPEQTGYGLGMRRLVIEGDTLIGHTGTIPGFGGAAFYCPEEDYSIALLGNLSFLDHGHILRAVIDVLHR